MKMQIKTYIKQIAFLLVVFLVISCSKDDASASIITRSSEEIKSVKLSQPEILQTILDTNPNNTFDWNLATTKDLGSLTGVTTNAQGRIIELDLNKKVLSVLPAEIGQLSSLTKLSVEDNLLNELPIETWSLINLRHLNLSSNQITSIPKGLKNLINLKYLNLNFNGLVTIPQEIGLLTNIEEIGLFEE